MITRVAGWGALAGVVALLVFSLWWRSDGGRWMRVETPSMGTVAPVGTLLWVRPAPFADLGPGDFITFHPPGRPDLTFSHRVDQRTSDGTVTTKGVLPAADPWRLSEGDVIGTVRMRWWGAGWIVVAAPWLLVGGCVVMALRSVVAARWRPAVSLVLGSVVVVGAIVWWQPLLGADQVALAPGPGGGVSATYVGTGLLPVKIAADPGGSVVLAPGEVGTVRALIDEGDGRAALTLSPQLHWWWWALLVGVCFLPALARLVVGERRPEPLESQRAKSHRRSARVAG